MTVERRYCVNHPERVAIGVCVETKKPICGECSTRYNGVNYSREGLEILRQRRMRERGSGGDQVGIAPLVFVGIGMTVILFGAYTILADILLKWIWPQ